MHDIQLHLTNAQFKKAVGGKSFQLTNTQLTNPDKNITLSFSNKSDYSKLMRNTRNGIGYRFMPSKFSVEESFDGGYIDGNVGKTVKKTAKNKGNLVFNNAAERMAHVRSCKKNNCKKSENVDEEIIDGGKFKIGRAIKRGVRKVRKNVNKTVKSATKTANNVANNTVKTYNTVSNNKHVKAGAKVVKKQSIKLAKAGAKEIGKQASDKLIDLGFDAASAAANYVVPGSDEILEPVMKKGKQAAKKKARAGINKMNGKEFNNINIKGSGISYAPTMHFEKNVNQITEKNHSKGTIKGKGFLL